MHCYSLMVGFVSFSCVAARCKPCICDVLASPTRKFHLYISRDAMARRSLRYKSGEVVASVDVSSVSHSSMFLSACQTCFSLSFLLYYYIELLLL